jgi:hypothetical protein
MGRRPLRRFAGGDAGPHRYFATGQYRTDWLSSWLVRVWTDSSVASGPRSRAFVSTLKAIIGR